MPMKPENQNPFWPAVPITRRRAPRVIAVIVFAVFVLVAARLVMRIVWG